MSSARKHLPVVHSDERYEENAAARKRLADAARERMNGAIAACGPGAEAYAVWIERDKLGREPDRVTYVCRRDGGTWEPKNDDSVERITDGLPVTCTTLGGVKYTVDAVTVKDVVHWPFRWETSFQQLDEYRPQTAEQLKAAAQRRHDAAAAKQEAEVEAKRRAAAEHPQLALPGVVP